MILIHDNQASYSKDAVLTSNYTAGADATLGIVFTFFEIPITG